MLVYSNKEKSMRDCESISTFLHDVDWLDKDARMKVYDYSLKWKKLKESPQDMIKLLRPEFADNRTRLYAITCKNMLDEFALNRYLLQLVQAFKCEIHHNSFLTRFVIYGSLHIPWLVGHYFFWMLKSEYHQIEW